MTAAHTVSLHTPFGDVSAKRGRLMGLGAGMIALGVAAWAHPWTPLLVGAAAGWLLWLAGALMLGLTLLMSPSGLRLVSAGSSLFVVGAGVAMALRPEFGALATALLLASVFILDGGWQLALALRLKPFAAWRWMFASALASLLVAGVFATSFVWQGEGAIAPMLALAFVTTGLGAAATGLWGGPPSARPS